MQSIKFHPEHHVVFQFSCNKQSFSNTELKENLLTLYGLNAAARADIVCWHLFAVEWNGISILWQIAPLYYQNLMISQAHLAMGLWNP